MQRLFSFSRFIFCASTFLTIGIFALPQTASATISVQKKVAPHQLTIIFGDTIKTVPAEITNTWVKAQSITHIDRTYAPEIEADLQHCPLIAPMACTLLFSVATKHSLKSRFALVPQKDTLTKFVDELNHGFIKDPVDAKFSLENGKISAFEMSQNGIKLDTNRSLTLLSATLNATTPLNEQTLTLPTITLLPSIIESQASSFGITALIGEGRTNFAGSPVNRIHNFKRALVQFNGVLIAPSEEFSFVKYLGEVDDDHGYLPELVIKKDKTEPEFGGGVCQVSTTVFRAALKSGLKITERRNHAYPVRYYMPYGMDATIYIPRPDLKFINNTPGHILIQAVIDGTTLIIRFYGTLDGRITAINGPHILEHNPDGSMKTIFTQTVTDKDGKEFIRDDFRSNYASPSKYPHLGQEIVLVKKPDDWSQSQWSNYKQTHNH
jgi:vancomycin resistance protein YoaR